MRLAERGDLPLFDASDWKVGLVVAQFNRHITEKLYESAVARSVDYKLGPENLVTAKVAGAGEIPLVLHSMAATRSYKALLAIGCVIRGETAHFDFVCRLVTDGILRVQMEWQQPVGFGVLTCESEEQARERASLGGEHFDAVMQQARVLLDLDHVSRNTRE